MKKRRRESRKARVDILLIGNQSFHLFLYPLIIFTFFKLSFLSRVFFPLYSIPSHLFMPSLASRPPCTRFEWHLKINQDVNNWTKIVNCGAFETTWENLVDQNVLFLLTLSLDRAFGIKKVFWCLHTIIIIIWTIIDIIFDIQQNKTWCPWMREVCLGLKGEGIILVGRAHFCHEALPYCRFYQRRRTQSACPYFPPQDPGMVRGVRDCRYTVCK